MEKLFSYGTLQDKDVQIKVWGTVISGKEDEFDDYTTLPIVQDRIEYLRAVEALGKKIVGKVYELTSDNLKNTDIYEGQEYERIKVDLENEKDVWVYAMKKSLK